MKDVEVTILKKHKLVIENGNLSVDGDGDILSRMKFVKQDIIFEFPNQAKLTMTLREFKPGSLIEIEIDEDQFDSIKTELRRMSEIRR